MIEYDNPTYCIFSLIAYKPVHGRYAICGGGGVGDIVPYDIVLYSV